MGSPLYLQGRTVSDQDLVWFRQVCEDHPDWSRKRLARELCQHWDWCDGRGQLKDFAARSCCSSSKPSTCSGSHAAGEVFAAHADYPPHHRSGSHPPLGPLPWLN